MKRIKEKNWVIYKWTNKSISLISITGKKLHIKLPWFIAHAMFYNKLLGAAQLREQLNANRK